jgi:hypothetical protein
MDETFPNKFRKILVPRVFVGNEPRNSLWPVGFDGTSGGRSADRFFALTLEKRIDPALHFIFNNKKNHTMELWSASNSDRNTKSSVSTKPNSSFG